MIFVMMATTILGAITTEEIAVWDLVKTTIGVQNVLVRLVQTTIQDGGVMVFAMMETTTKVATMTEEIAAWDLLKTTTGVLFVLAWIQMLNLIQNCTLNINILMNIL